MSISKIAGLLLSSAAMVAGHGYVSGAVVDGTYHGGFIVNTYNYMSEVPANIGWSEKATDLGFIDGSSYASSDIICHKEATPGALSAEVKAGGKVELQWTEWPESHHGPVITYMANCNGDCSTVDKTTLKFFKIAEAGLIDDSNVPGKWATDELISNNNSATVTIPSTIAAGNYVLRHEIIALHSAGELNGAQNYPQCLNLKVTGGGSDAPDGVLGTALYKATDPGIEISIYTSLASYEIPGPALYTGATSGSSSTTAAATTAAATTAAATTATTAASTTASSPADVTITSTASGQSAQSSTPASGNDDTESTVTATATATAAPTAAASSSSSSGSSSSSSSDYSTYLSSLSAEKLLETIRSTLKWLVSDKKVHARALAY